MIKDPGPGGMRLRNVSLDMSFAEAFNGPQSGRLRAPADGRHPLQPDAVHAPRRSRSGMAWVDPILKGWEATGQQVQGYTAGTWGPSQAIALIERDGRTWHDE
jgi:glucose-6-phosphate 1-dehydrogenase